MDNSIKNTFLADWRIKVSVGLLLIFFVWWVVLHLLGFSSTSVEIQVWAVLYQTTALFGGIMGLIISKKWGGFKSAMGLATILFSIGLLFQNIAQSAGSYLAWKLGTVPYPSFSDVGAFGALIFYAIGSIYLAKISGAHVSLRSYKNKVIAIILPLIFLGVSFFIFLRAYEYDWSQPLRTFLDIGYPLGEAFYLSMAILAYLLTRNYLGGVMRVPILFFIGALAVEYIADFMFLYDSIAESYVYGGFNDLLFVIAYSLMAISLIQLGVVYKKIQQS